MDTRFVKSFLQEYAPKVVFNHLGKFNYNIGIVVKSDNITKEKELLSDAKRFALEIGVVPPNFLSDSNYKNLESGFAFNFYADGKNIKMKFKKICEKLKESGCDIEIEEVKRPPKFTDTVNIPVVNNRQTKLF